MLKLGHTTPNNFLYILEGVRVSTSRVFYDIRDPPVCRFYRAQNNRYTVLFTGPRGPPFGGLPTVEAVAPPAKALSC